MENKTSNQVGRGVSHNIRDKRSFSGTK